MERVDLLSGSAADGVAGGDEMGCSSIPASGAGAGDDSRRKDSNFSPV